MAHPQHAKEPAEQAGSAPLLARMQRSLRKGRQQRRQRTARQQRPAEAGGLTRACPSRQRLAARRAGTEEEACAAAGRGDEGVAEAAIADEQAMQAGIADAMSVKDAQWDEAKIVVLALFHTHEGIGKSKVALQRAQQMLTVTASPQLPTVRQTALAYDRLRDALGLLKCAQDAQGLPGAEKPIKAARLIVSDLFALQCFAATGASGVTFDVAAAAAFDRTPESELNSQIYQSKSNILRFGKGSQAKLHEQYVQQCRRTLSEQVVATLFAAYQVASESGVMTVPSTQSARAASRTCPRLP